jgi:hypothetical protein
MLNISTCGLFQTRRKPDFVHDTIELHDSYQEGALRNLVLPNKPNYWHVHEPAGHSLISFVRILTSISKWSPRTPSVALLASNSHAALRVHVLTTIVFSFRDHQPQNPVYRMTGPQWGDFVKKGGLT